MSRSFACFAWVASYALLGLHRVSVALAVSVFVSMSVSVSMTVSVSATASVPVPMSWRVSVGVSKCICGRACDFPGCFVGSAQLFVAPQVLLMMTSDLLRFEDSPHSCKCYGYLSSKVE